MAAVVKQVLLIGFTNRPDGQVKLWSTPSSQHIPYWDYLQYLFIFIVLGPLLPFRADYNTMTTDVHSELVPGFYLASRRSESRNAGIFT